MLTIKERKEANRIARRLIAANGTETVHVRTDGTVATTKLTFQSNDITFQEPEWNDICAITLGYQQALGLRSDGHLIYEGISCNTAHDLIELSTDYSDIAIGDSSGYLMGLSKEGNADYLDVSKVHKRGKNCIAVENNGYMIHQSGKVRCVGPGMTLEDGCHSPITALSGNENLVIYLQNDGTVKAAETDQEYEFHSSGFHSSIPAPANLLPSDTEHWNHIIDVAAGSCHVVGLKEDGTVVAAGNNIYGQCNVSDWTDIIAVFAGDFHTVGLKGNGTVLATGNNNHNQCNVSSWKLFKNIFQLEQEQMLNREILASKKQAQEYAKKQENFLKKRAELKNKVDALQAQIDNLSMVERLLHKKELQKKLDEAVEELMNLEL